MTKPVIVTRAGKGSALTFVEADANVTNLQNATITVAADSGTSQTLDLNDTLTIVGGTGLTSVASATDTVTLNLDNTAVTAAAYTYASITVDAQGRLTAASNGTAPLVSGGALGTPSSGTLTNCTFPTLNQNTTGSAATLTTPRAINGVNFDGSAAITVTAAASTLSGSTLASGVTASSLTSLGTIATGVWNGSSISTTYTDAKIVSITGTADQISVSAGTTPTLSLPSAVTMPGSLTVTGNLTVNGTTTTVNSTTTTVDDPIFTLGGDTAPGSDDNKDRGIEFRWHNGTNAKVGFFGYDDSTGYLTFIPDATNTSEVFSGTQGDIQATNFRGALVGNASTATTAAALTTARTVAITGDLTYTSASFDGSANVTGVGTLANTAVTAGSYTYASITVDGKGRITAASNGTAPLVSGGALGTPSSGTLTNATGLPIGTGVSGLGTSVATFLATPSSANLISAVTDETGTGALVFATSPTLVTPALGTPASGVVTNLTGTASININGTVGATTAGTGAFTTISSSGLTTANSLTVTTSATLKDIRETVSALTYGATITPDAADGSIRTVTLTGNVTFSAFTNPVSGQTITLIITQDGTGSRTLTSTMKFAGASKTLSTAASSVDILTVSYIGSTYYASLVKGYA